LFNKYQYSFEANFPNDITGVGHQLAGTAQEVNESSIMKVNNTNLSSDDLLFFGHDGDPISLIDESDPSVSSLPLGNNKVLDRVWRADLTGVGGAAQVKVDVSSLLSELQPDETFRLLVMDDFETNDYSNAIQFKGTLSGDTLTVSGVEFDNDTFFSLGKVSAEANTNFFTFQDGTWQDASIWTTDPSGDKQVPVGGQVPNDGSSVTILNGDNVTIPDTDSTKQQSEVNIESGGMLDLTTTTGHEFNDINGAGLLRLSSVSLPTGSYVDFVSPSGGTIEYFDVSGILPATQTIYNNLLFTNSTGTNHTLTVGSDLTINGILETERTGGGLLTLTVGDNSTARTITVNGNTTVGSGTIFNVGTSNATHNIIFNADLTNNGSIDFQVSNGEMEAFFRGNTNNQLVSNGTTNLYTLELDKGTDQTFTLTVSSSADNFDITASNNLLRIRNGTLILKDNINLNRVHGSGNWDVGFDQNTNGAFIIDGATVDMTNSNALVVYGLFRLDSGTISIADQGMVNREDGEIQINGGIMNVSKYRVSNTSLNHRGSFTMTGGTMNIDEALGQSGDGQAAFAMPFDTQSLTVTGGTINVMYAESSGTAANGGIQIAVDPSNATIEGGTWNITIPDNGTDFGIASSVPFWNMNVKSAGGSGEAIIRDLDATVNGSTFTVNAEDLVILNDFSMESTNTPEFNANGFDASFQDDFTINSGAIFENTGTTNTVNFNQVSTQFVVLDEAVTFDNLNVTTGDTAFFSGAVNPVINDTLSLASGSALDLNNIDFLANGDIVNSGEFITENSGTVFLQSASGSQTISGDGGGSFTNLVLDNTNGTAGSEQIFMAANQLITNLLRLNQDRLFNIGSSRLTLGSASTLDAGSGSFGANRMIITNGQSADRGIQKVFNSAQSFTYQFGTGTDFTPATINVSNTDGASGSVRIRPVASEHPNVTMSGISLTYFWKVTSTGFGSSPTVTHTYNYVESDVNGSEPDYIFGRFDPDALSWSSGTTSDVDDTNNIIGGTGTGLENVNFIEGDFTAGEAAAFDAVTVFYSRQNGDWNTQSTWSNEDVGGAEGTGTPGAGDPVVIGDGSIDHTITVQSVESAVAGNVALSESSILDLGSSTGNDLGTLLEGEDNSGFGTIRISSGNFPAGDFSDFVAGGAGTIEYYRDGSDFALPASQSTYNNLTFSTENGAAGTLTMPATDLTINGTMRVGETSNAGALTVLSDANGNRTISISENLLVRGASTGNTTFTLTSGANHNFTVNGDVTVGSNGNFDVQNSGSNVHNIIISGDLANGGGVDFTSGGTVADVTFNSSINRTITGGGSPFSFNNLTLDKGTDTLSVLDVTAANMTIVDGGLNLVNGTFKLNDSQPLTLSSGGEFLIPSTTQLWVNGPTVDITGSGTMKLVGKLQISNNSIVSIGNGNNDNFLEYAATGMPELIIKSGSLTLTSQLRRPTGSATGNLKYRQTGGSVTVATQQAPVDTRGVFEVVNDGDFSMTSGTLTIVRSQSSGSVASLLLDPASSSVTGGDIFIGDDTNTPSGELVTVNSSIPLHNLTVNSTNSRTAQLSILGLTLNNNLLIESGATFDANGLPLNIGGNFTNNGTFTSNLNLTTFNSSSQNQTITGSTAFHDLVIDNSFGGTVNIDNSTAFTIDVDNDFSLRDGTFEVNQSTVNVAGDIELSSTHLSSNGGQIILNGGVEQFITGDGTGSFDNVEFNNNAGFESSTAFGVTGTMTLTDGILNIRSNALTLEENSSLAGSFDNSRMITTNGSTSDGGITKVFPDGATPDFTFPLGFDTDFTPAQFNFSSNSGNNNQLTVKPIASTISASTDDNGDGNDLLSYYWSVSSSGFSGISVTQTYTYVESDVQDGNEGDGDSNYEAGRFADGNWTAGTTNLGSVDNSTNVITIDGGTNTGNTGVDFLDGSYTAGELEEFGTLATFVSVQNGNWDDSNTWDQSGIPDGNPVVIQAPHTVNTNGNSRISSTLNLQGILDIGTDIGHDFGIVNGTGTLIVASSNFPAGDYDEFVAPDSGTVEFEGNITLPTRSVYNNVLFEDANTKTLPNVDITVNGNFTISNSSAVVDGSVNNRNITVLRDWSIVSSGNFIPGTGEVIFGGSTTQEIFGATTFYNLTITNTDLTGVNVNDNLTINNSLTVEAGILNTGAQDLTISGDITNNSTASSLNPGSGTITLNGSSAQTVGGNAALTFNNLTADNSSSTGIDLTNSITVNNTLSITDGNINTGSHLITLGATNGNITGETNARRVIGSLQVTRTVGTGSSLMGNIGVDISAKAGNDIGDVTIKRVTGSEGIVTINGGTSIARRWVINADNDPNDREVTFSWLSADDNGKDMTRMRLFRRSNEGSGNFSNITDFLNVSGSDPRNLTAMVNSFSEFATSDDESTLPVELIEFNGEIESSTDRVLLTWSTATEKENFGFFVNRAFIPLDELNSGGIQDTVWTEIGFVEGAGTTLERQDYRFIDSDIDQAGKYLYQLKQVDFGGLSEYFGPVEVELEVPEKPELQNNYPNPFNPTTNITYKVSRTSKVLIEVYNVLGQKVTTLVDEQNQPGTFTVVFDGSGLTSGMYLVRMQVDGNVFTRKMMMIK